MFRVIFYLPYVILMQRLYVASFKSKRVLHTTFIARRLAECTSGIDNFPDTIYNKKFGSLLGSFIGDALSVPSHWIYNISQLHSDYGVIQSYMQPKELMLDSKLVLAFSYDKVIGNHILHTKLPLYRLDDVIFQRLSTQQNARNLDTYTRRYYHYHGHLRAGENSLEALLMRVVMRHLAVTVTAEKQFAQTSYLEDYKLFMTTPGTHNDSFASTCHRMFFYNHYYKNLPLNECADNDNHNVEGIDGLVATIPVILKHLSSSRLIRNQAVKQIIHSTRRTRRLDKYAETYADILVAVVTSTHTLRQAVEYYGARLSSDNDGDDDDGLSGMRSYKTMVESDSEQNRHLESLHRAIVTTAEAATDVDKQQLNVASFIASIQPGSTIGLSTACYIDPAFQSLLFLAYKYSDKSVYSSPEIGLLINANLGGENCARGCLLGALLGAEYGHQHWPEWCVSGLTSCEEIEQEIRDLLELI